MGWLSDLENSSSSSTKKETWEPQVFQYAGHTQGKRIECDVRSSDELLRSLSRLSRLGLIKLDVEGAELLALKGLTETLKEHTPAVVFECHSALGDNGGLEIFKFLRSHGYSQFFELQSSVLGSLGSRFWSPKIAPT